MFAATDGFGVAHRSALVQVANGWGPVEADRSNGERLLGDGRRLTLAGVGYDKGLGVHARSEVQVALDRACSRFLSSVGVDDEVGSNGSVIFKVYADNTKIFDSGVLRGSSPTRDVDLDVRGVAGLRLVVTDAGDGIDSDHADWADARLACATAAPVTPATASQVDSEHSGATATPVPRGANELWARNFPGGDVRMPLVVGDRVFVTVGYVVDPVDHWGKAVRLVALDRRSGVELWSAWLHDDLANNTDFAFATYGDGKVFAVTTGGRLSAFHAVTGQNLWTVQLRDLRVSSAPTAFGGQIYVYGYENSFGWVWSLNQLDGRVNWEFYSQWLGGSESSPPSWPTPSSSPAAATRLMPSGAPTARSCGTRLGAVTAVGEPPPSITWGASIHRPTVGKAGCWYAMLAPAPRLAASLRFFKR
ncbi:MAG TPA: NPCBM/NEW2 domain-containing protein [Acidimicrobiales bacterium]|nr:NPCBM/NEW2 domain-containing protein [Acidimicrobiales bacterium]